MTTVPVLCFQMTLCGKPENTAAIVAIIRSSIWVRIDPNDTSMTPLSPEPMTNCSRSSGSGLAGLDSSGPTSLVSSHEINKIHRCDVDRVSFSYEFLAFMKDLHRSCALVAVRYQI